MRLLEDNLAGEFLATEALKPGTTIIVDLDTNREISVFVNRNSAETQESEVLI